MEPDRPLAAHEIGTAIIALLIILGATLTLGYLTGLALHWLTNHTDISPLHLALGITITTTSLAATLHHTRTKR